MATTSSIIEGLGKFVLGAGTGLGVAMLLSYTGTDVNDDTVDKVENFTTNVQEDMQSLIDYANEQIELADGEKSILIEKLNEANSNINSLINHYAQIDTQYQTELATLETKIGEMQTRLDTQYKDDMNAVITKANEEIRKANEDVTATNGEVTNLVGGKTSEGEDIVTDGSNYVALINSEDGTETIKGEIETIEQNANEQKVIDISGIINGSVGSGSDVANAVAEVLELQNTVMFIMNDGSIFEYFKEGYYSWQYHESYDREANRRYGTKVLACEDGYIINNVDSNAVAKFYEHETSLQNTIIAKGYNFSTPVMNPSNITE